MYCTYTLLNLIFILYFFLLYSLVFSFKVLFILVYLCLYSFPRIRKWYIVCYIYVFRRPEFICMQSKGYGSEYDHALVPNQSDFRGSTV
jgi:hypothetical protein